MDKVIKIPENVTNGDMINALFPNAKDIRVDGGYPLNYIIEGEWHRNLKEWWDKPYSSENKKLEQVSNEGHWIITKEDNGYETIITDCKCSVCGKKALLNKSYSMDGESIVFCPSNYCPNCGKKLIKL